jgi:hypothetical protein
MIQVKNLRTVLIFLLLIVGLAVDVRPGSGPGADAAKVRTITLGIPLTNSEFRQPVTEATSFLELAKKKVTSLGYEVQTLRVTTPPCGNYLKGMAAREIVTWGQALDEAATKGNIIVGLGPANGIPPETLASLLSGTKKLSATISVTTADNRIDEASVEAAARTILALSKRTKDGIGNFNFAAIAGCPPGIPFFPAGYSSAMTSSFALGMEGAVWVQRASAGEKSLASIKARLRDIIHKDLTPLVETMKSLEKIGGRTFSGFDVSPAPSGKVSIGRAIESLSGSPVGSPGTLAICAAITDVLKGLPMKTCGFSGLMLPVMEDTTLAMRAAEGRLTLDQLLLYSAVCGTGLDVVPLPGDISEEKLESIIRDVASLSVKWHKPLSARLLPVPGKKAGDLTSFNDSVLVNTRVLSVPE